MDALLASGWLTCSFTLENMLSNLKTKRAKDRKKYGGKQRKTKTERWFSGKSFYNYTPLHVFYHPWICMLLQPLTQTTKKWKIKYHLQVGGSVQYSQRVKTLLLCLKDKRGMEWNQEQTRLCDCSDAWVAISAFSTSTSPEGHGGGYKVGRALKETREGGGRMESNYNGPLHLSFDSICLNMIKDWLRMVC